MENITKYISSFLYAAVISGLGAGVWFTILEPSFVWLFNHLFQFWDLIHTNFIDSIYERALKEEVTIWYANITLYLRFIFLFVFFILIKKMNDSLIRRSAEIGNEKVIGYVNKIVLISYFLFIIVAFFALSHIYKASIAKTISAYAYDGLEIVRPNMTESEYLELKSKIIQGNSKSDFNLISNQLKNYADSDHVLPKEPAQLDMISLLSFVNNVEMAPPPNQILKE